MPRTYWNAPLPPLNFADGTPVTAITLTDASPAPQKIFYPGQLELGTIVRLSARGEITTSSTANTLTLGFYYGGVAGVAIAAGAALAVPVSETAVQWWMEWEGEVRALGATGSIKGIGKLHIPGASPGLATDMPTLPIPQTAAARTVTIDTTTQKAVTVGAAWSAATGAPTLTCYGLSVVYG
jgi:hypothetical protein